MFRKKWFWIALALVVVAAGGGYYYYAQAQPEAEATEGSDLQTTKVRRGDLTISATGSGEVISAETVELGFETNGTVTEVNITTGDEVAANAVLASIDDTSAQKSLVSAQLQVANAEEALLNAQLAYDELLEEPTEAELLAAEASVKNAQEKLDELQEGATEAEIASAEANLASAQEEYDDLVNGPTAYDLEQAQISVEKAQNSVWSAQMSRDAKGTTKDKESGAYDSAQVQVYNAELSLRTAQMSLEELQEPATSVELQNAKAKVASAAETLADLKEAATEADLVSAQADLAKAQESLDELVDGASDDDITLAQANITQAQLSLEQAQLSLADAESDLEATDLVSPISGTVMDVDIEVGERVTENSTVVTVADLSLPILDVYLDESDLDMFKVGYEVQVEFDAIPEVVFEGHVTQVDPQLSTQSNVNVIHGQVELDADSFAKPEGLIPGMTATVDVIGGSALNAVLVPVEALRDLGDGQYAVFVMENGEPRMKVVEVGLQDYTYAEVTSGLDGGETITTGIVETN